jgi:hypothetical protein
MSTTRSADSTGNPHWDRLLAEARHLRAVNSRLAEGLLRQFEELDDWARAQVAEDMSANSRGADRIERQVLWYRHMAGEVFVAVPDGPAWRD